MSEQTNTVLTVACFAASNLGKVRKNNEDKFLLNTMAVNDRQLEAAGTENVLLNGGVQELSGSHLLMAVCDGMGGEDCGEVASRIAVEELLHLYESPETLEAEVESVLERANERIFAQIEELDLERIGTTAAVAWIKDGQLTAVNVGDSRVYLQREGALKRLSLDHTEVQYFIDAKLITEEEAQHHPMRHRVTQHLGMDTGKTRLSPHICRAGPLQAGDRVLLCSDGLTDMLNEDQISRCLLEGGTAGETAQRLIENALQAGGGDNVTVIVALIQ